MNAIKQAKVKIGEKIAYACGDTSANLAWRPLIAFLPIFYTDTFGLPAVTVGVLLFITRISDGVTDIIMGTIADRTETRWGKFRPWLLWTALPFGLLLALTFTTPNLNFTGKLIWAYTTYIVLTLLYTANNVPYSALLGVITGNVKERTNISSFRFFGAYLGGGIALGLANYLVDNLGKGNDKLGYQYAFSVFGALLVIFSIITFLYTHERIKPPKSQVTSLKNDFKDLIKNKPWIIILIIGFLWVSFNSIKQGSTMYYFTHFMGRKDLAGYYMVALIIASIGATFITPSLSNFFGKKTLFIIVMITTGFITSLIYFAKATDIILIFSLGILAEIAAGVMPILFFAMLGDAADYSEWINKRRATGLVFSAGTFAMKFGGGVAGAVTLFVLSIFGYEGQNQAKITEALEGIKLNMSIVPTLFIVFAIIIMFFYPLSKEKMIQIEQDLNNRREKNNI
ncbi:MAG: MFS transporter [Bacteroidales bacterium]|nr:MFS transporter [Bacteroidales bacterium]